MSRFESGAGLLTDLSDLPNAREFTWRDGERVDRLRASGMLARRAESLGGEGWERFELLTTAAGAERRAARARRARAAGVHEVAARHGRRCLRRAARRRRLPTLVALGGGRVIDVAKAIAAVRGGRVAAIPTTLSGAEMTGIHRLPDGHEAPRLVRPALVLGDPGR